MADEVDGGATAEEDAGYVFVVAEFWIDDAAGGSVGVLDESSLGEWRVLVMSATFLVISRRAWCVLTMAKFLCCVVRRNFYLQVAVADVVVRRRRGGRI